MMQRFPGRSPAFQGVPDEKIERNNFLVEKDQDLIGRLATMKLEKGDTLPDIARHFSLGIDEVNAANPGVDTWVPAAREQVILPLSHILPDTPRKGIVINLATMRLFHFMPDGRLLAVSTYPVGVGTAERPSPVGQMYVQRKTFRPTWYVPASIAEDHRKKGDPLPAKVLPGPLNPLGEFALYLSKSTYLIHGTNKPYSIGLNATNGCIRLYPEDIKRLYDSAPVNTPVQIVNQPYLVGQRDGVIYMEAHTPSQGVDATEREKVYRKLKAIEKKSARILDWKEIEKTFSEARGIPVRISDVGQGDGKATTEIVQVRHPDRLYGRPEIPDFRENAWYVSAGDLRDKTKAAKLAAIINHQGPQIPARVLAGSNTYRVLSGPFDDIHEARGAVKQLRVDLEIEGVVVEPLRTTGK